MGMIGGPAGVMGAPVGGVQRVNPVGGVIGQQPGGRPAGVGQVPAAGMLGGPQGQPRNRAAAAEGKGWDPDNPWAVEEGVAPVISPDVTRAVDPGPGIIGMDR
jgi:hypothetical protein